MGLRAIPVTVWFCCIPIVLGHLPGIIGITRGRTGAAPGVISVVPRRLLFIDHRRLIRRFIQRNEPYATARYEADQQPRYEDVREVTTFHSIHRTWLVDTNCSMPGRSGRLHIALLR